MKIFSRKSLKNHTSLKSDSSKKVKWSIKWKLMSTIFFLMLCLVSLQTYFQISSQKQLIESELEKRIALMKENLTERGKNFISNIAQQIEQDIAAFNFSRMIEHINQQAEDSREVKYIVLTDASGTIFVHTSNPDLARTKIEGGDAEIPDKIIIKDIKDDGENAVELITAVQISTAPWGRISVILTTKWLRSEIELSKQLMQVSARKMVQHALFSSLAIMIISVFIIYILARQFADPLIQLTESAMFFSEGDFTRRVPVRRVDEIGVLADAMNRMAANLNDIISKNAVTSKALYEACYGQAASVEKTNALLEEMSVMTLSNAKNASQADEFMGRTKQVVDRADDAMVQLNTSMDEVSAASRETFQIIKTIDEIAFQTNLLALNAAVEAARAGETGAGFAVVANEVRNLAMRAAEAAKNTAGMIEDIVKRIQDGTLMVKSANEGFKDVMSNAAEVAELVSNIAEASKEQKERIQQIDDAMQRMNDGIMQNASSAEALASSMALFKVLDSQDGNKADLRKPSDPLLLDLDS